MRRVHRWRAIVTEIDEAARVRGIGPGHLEFKLESRMADQVEAIRKTAAVSAVLEKYDMNADEFVRTTVLLSLGWASERLVDSLGPRGVPTNIPPQLAEFFRKNREELQWLLGSSRPSR